MSTSCSQPGGLGGPVAIPVPVPVDEDLRDSCCYGFGSVVPVLAPTPVKIKKSVRFNEVVRMSETFSVEEYDRSPAYFESFHEMLLKRQQQQEIMRQQQLFWQHLADLQQSQPIPSASVSAAAANISQMMSGSSVEDVYSVLFCQHNARNRAADCASSVNDSEEEEEENNDEGDDLEPLEQASDACSLPDVNLSLCSPRDDGGDSQFDSFFGIELARSPMSPSCPSPAVNMETSPAPVSESPRLSLKINKKRLFAEVRDNTSVSDDVSVNSDSGSETQSNTDTAEAISYDDENGPSFVTLENNGKRRLFTPHCSSSSNSNSICGVTCP